MGGVEGVECCLASVESVEGCLATLLSSTLGQCTHSRSNSMHDDVTEHVCKVSVFRPLCLRAHVVVVPAHACSHAHACACAGHRAQGKEA